MLEQILLHSRVTYSWVLETVDMLLLLESILDVGYLVFLLLGARLAMLEMSE